MSLRKDIVHKAPPLRRSAVREYNGSLEGQGLRIGIVSGQFNPDLTQPLAQSAIDELAGLGVRHSDIELAWVPGAFEIPIVLAQWARSKRFDALIALGVVLQGATPHAALICNEVGRAIAELSRLHQRPILDGVVTADQPGVARERCVGRTHNRGRHAARAAVQMANLLKGLRTR